MRRSVWIFFASILLPSLGLAWLAVRSVRDQQVVLEHQQVIISQDITDALAKSIQGQMDQVRADFVAATQQLLNGASSSQALAGNFNHSLPQAWPMAEIGFAVNLNGDVYSPKPYDSQSARMFLDENDRFLSNRENAEVYSFNPLTAQNAFNSQNSFNVQNVQNAPVTAKLAFRSPTAQQPTKTAAIQGQMASREQKEQSFRDTSAGHTTESTDLKKNAAAQRANTDSIDDLESNAATTHATAPGAAAAAAQPAAQSLAASAAPASDISTAMPPATGGAAPAPAPMTASSDEATPVDKGTTIAVTGSAQSTVATSPTAPEVTASLNSPVAGEEAKVSNIARNVVPQKMLASQSASISNTVPEESDFRRVIGSDTSGELARFLDDKLRLLVWSRTAPDAAIIFGAQLDEAKVVDALKASFLIPELAPDSANGRRDYCVAILDDTGQPVALSQPGFSADWKHPFVSTEIGQALPHWEAALYLIDPGQIGHAARTLQATLALIVLVLVAAIVAGGSLIAADVRRQVRLAQQKTDFVSNVSHELKTPLTSIRMFADLLAEKRVPDEERQSTYLRIIAAEAARLTRLINNVLDFARLEKGKPAGERHACDLVDAVRDVAGTCSPHLEAEGIAFRLEVEADALPIRGDRDALAQIILNLISNAEKYGGKDILVRVRQQETPNGRLGCVDVLDRGPGIALKNVKTIFEPFHRLDDSLASGIPGSGLGLTLARRMARAHGGDVSYSARSGGGSCFTLSVPLENAAP